MKCSGEKVPHCSATMGAFSLPGLLKEEGRRHQGEETKTSTGRRREGK